MNRWIKFMISTGFFLKINLTLRKRSVLRKDEYLNVLWCEDFSTHPTYLPFGIK